ncbi:MAG TPA: DNA-3-methyladenine glycosylase 2 family protein [Rhodanobacteraceae bacterium]
MSGRKQREHTSAFAFDAAGAVAHLEASDAALAKLIDRVGPFGMQLKSTSTLFDVLAEAIVYQQLHTRAAESIHTRVRALIPRTRGIAAARALAEVSDDALRSAGLSRSKLLALRDLAAKTLDGHVPTLAKARRMDDEAIIEHLTEVRGIGRWTVQMLLMFRLGRPDVLPVGDYGIRKGFAVAFRKREIPAPADVEKRGERWRPYRTVASWYLWRAAESS